MLYKRLQTREVRIGDLFLGNGHPILVQTMTTTDTMDTAATVAQTIRCIEAGADMVRITAPSRNEAENLANIRNELRMRGYNAPLIADIHFTPNAAEIAARIVEKVRVNPGNYADKKRFDFIEYSDVDYAAEIERIRERFVPLVRICREHGTAMRIGVNHGSLSDRIMSRYGDSPIGMVESALEFLRITRDERYHEVILSMKSSNPMVMVQAYRLLVQKMYEEFGECYPLHLGVTEAGDGVDGRVKSAIGIASLLEEGIGDTIRVSLTEDPEFEIPVCRNIVSRYGADFGTVSPSLPLPLLPASLPPLFCNLPYDPFAYKRRQSRPAGNIGGEHVPVVVADFTGREAIAADDLIDVGYRYDAASDKWSISDSAVDYILTDRVIPAFALPGLLQVLTGWQAWQGAADKSGVYPVVDVSELPVAGAVAGETQVFVRFNPETNGGLKDEFINWLKEHRAAVVLLGCNVPQAQLLCRAFFIEMMSAGAANPVIIESFQNSTDPELQLITNSINAGSLFLDGMGDGVLLRNALKFDNRPVAGRTALECRSNEQFLNNTAFTILQATRTRISKTEYISCPSCGRTLFDLQETTARIREATHHLKGVKIAIMGCIVNGPGEMADADFGYVGSGPGKITLYKGKDIVKRSVPSDIAVSELIMLLKEHDAWVEPVFA